MDKPIKPKAKGEFSTIEKATTVTVRKHHKKSLESGEDDEESESERTIDVHAFVTEPSKVMYEAGATINMGNYESVRVTVGITIPCYKEEIHGAYEFARSFVTARVQSEVKKHQDHLHNSQKDKEIF